MKTKEEIIEDATGIGRDEQSEEGWVIDFSDVYEVMDIYAAQEVERARAGTCKWATENQNYKPECYGYSLTRLHLRITGYVYCPFCGRKIERV